MTDTPEPATPDGAPLALWAGDSFTAGEGSRGHPFTYPFLVSAALGWQCVLDAQCGTGFVNPGHLASPDFEPLLARLPGLRRRHPHAREVIVDAGRNDSEESELAVALAARSYLDAVRAGWPTATVTVLLPTLLEARQPAGYQRISGLLREICAGRPGVRVVDPGADAEFVRACESPGRWTLVCPDGFHPSHQGQGLYARVLTRLLA